MRAKYVDELKHPRWQEKRLRVFEAAGFHCERCGNADQQLHAHHKIYLKGRRPWEYEDQLLECLCDDCHERAHDEQQQLALIVAQQPTAKLPYLMDALLGAVYDREVPSQMSPRVHALFTKIGKALSTGEPTAFIDAQNDLQDMRDERTDFLRGPGGR